MTHNVDQRHGAAPANAAPPAGGAGARPKIAEPIQGWRGKITSHFGHRESPGGVGSTNHPGLDIGAPSGTPIQAAKDGKVVFAGAAGGYGNLVVIGHPDGTFTKYAHQSEITAHVGQEVQAGDVIGKVGSTGNSTGPHLHFEVRKGDWNNGPLLDPEAYLEGSEQVAASDPGPGQSFSGGGATVGGGGTSSGMSLGGGSSGGASGGGASGGSASAAGSAAPAASAGASAPPAGGTAVPAGNFTTLLAKLDGMGLSLDYLRELCKRLGIPLELLLAIIMQESGGNPNAKSAAGAQGLMQLMPDTARGLGVANAFDPKQNVEGGAKYLAQLKEQFGGDTTKMLAAYNAGPGNVEKFGGVPPFAETQQYVANISASLENAKSAIA